MFETLKKVAITGVVLITGTTAIPVIPAEMELLYSYRDDCIWEAPKDATTTVSDPRPYIPECTKGEYAVSVFADRKGNEVYIEIPVEKYAEMGEPQGYTKNTQKDEYLTLFEQVILQSATVVEGAIATTSYSNPAQVVASSITYAATTTSPDAGLVVIASMNDLADTCRQASYNGVAMNYVGEVSMAGGGGRSERLTAFYNIATTTGTFNVVVTCTGAISNGLDARALTFTGVSQTEMLNTSGGYTAGASATTSISTNLTSTTSDVWSVSGIRNTSGPMTSSTNCVVRDSNATSMCNSTTSLGVAGSYQTQVTTAFSGTMQMYTLFISPSGGGGGSGIIPLEQIIFFQ